MRKKTKEIAEKYDQTAGHYDSRYESIQIRKYEEAFKDLKKYTCNTNYLESNNHFLDAGCGTGLLSTFLKKYISLAGRLYVGVDVSLDMIKIAAKEHEGHYIQASVDLLPFRKARFDAVFSFSTIQNLDEPQHSAFFKEVANIIRISGIFLLSFLDKPPLNKDYGAIRKKLEDGFDSISFLDWNDMEDKAFIACKKNGKNE